MRPPRNSNGECLVCRGHLCICDEPRLYPTAEERTDYVVELRDALAIDHVLGQMSDRYTCPRCDTRPRRYGEVHSCSGYDEHFVVYLNQGMTPFFLTERLTDRSPVGFVRRLADAALRKAGVR